MTKKEELWIQNNPLLYCIHKNHIINVSFYFIVMQPFSWLRVVIYQPSNVPLSFVVIKLTFFCSGCVAPSTKRHI